MIPYFPKQIGQKAFYFYIGSLATVTVLYYRYAMPIFYIGLGLLWVAGFFLLGAQLSKEWLNLPEKRFVRNVALTALGLRVTWVLFSYFFYSWHTGSPFEFDAADAHWYYEESQWMIHANIGFLFKYLFLDMDAVSDSGYLFYLALIGRITRGYIIPTRLVNTLLSVATVMLLYRLAQRNIGEEVGRMTAIFACLMPNLIVYCGLHLKETVMVFLLVAYMERADALLRGRKHLVWNIVAVVVLGISLFTFRTVLGGAAIFALVTAVVVSSKRVIGTWRRVMFIGWGLLAVTFISGGTIVNEAEGLWEQRDSNQNAKRTSQTAKGNQWAKYATGSVMAPMMFVMPFPTMVNPDGQYNQQILSGGNYVRNFMGVFVLIAVFSAIFITKNWRDLSLIGSFVIAYLGIVASSGFANSERFLLPALPFLLLIGAYGVTLLDAKNYRFVKAWCWVMPAMALGWAYFKLGSRALL